LRKKKSGGGKNLLPEKNGAEHDSYGAKGCAHSYSLHAPGIFGVMVCQLFGCFFSIVW